MNAEIRSRRVTKALLIGSSALMAGLTIAAAGAAYAADNSSTVSEVVVTGSRIAKRDFTSSSPIVTVGSTNFENTANVAIEATLNKLPQFTPDQNQTGVQAQDVQGTSTHTVGISTLSLRGLGPNRNVVLIDGRRAMPMNGEMVVDVSAIPSAAIDNVEIITGGASAVYGADAVAGVVNFKLKKDFQGVDIDTQYGITQAGDGQEFKASVLLGTNFADDKGNVMLGLEHFTRAASYQKNRDFYTKGWADPSVGTNEFFDTGAFYSPTFGAPSQAAVDALFYDRAPGSVIPNNVIGEFGINKDGTIYTGAAGLFGSGGAAGAYRYNGTVDGKKVAYVNVIDAYNGGVTARAIKDNQTNYYVTAPLNRWSMFGKANYQFNNDLSMFVEGNFAQTHTHTILFPTPFITGWGVLIPHDAAHPVSPQLEALLNSRTGVLDNSGFHVGPAAAAAAWELFLIPDPSGWMPPRSTDVTNRVWQMTAGLDGKLPVSDWSYELYGSHGEASSYTLGLGYASLNRYQEVLQSPNYGAGQTFTGNAEAPNFGFGVASAHCTSGFYSAIFQGGTPSKDCIDAITANLQSMTTMEQNIVEYRHAGRAVQSSRRSGPGFAGRVLSRRHPDLLAGHSAKHVVVPRPGGRRLSGGLHERLDVRSGRLRRVAGSCAVQRSAGAAIQPGTRRPLLDLHRQRPPERRQHQSQGWLDLQDPRRLDGQRLAPASAAATTSRSARRTWANCSWASKKSTPPARRRLTATPARWRPLRRSARAALAPTR